MKAPGTQKNSLSYIKEMLYKKYFSLRDTTSFIEVIAQEIDVSDFHIF